MALVNKETKERKSQRRLFTICAKKIETMILDEKVYNEIYTEFKKLRELMTLIKTLDESVKGAILEQENFDEEALETELTHALEYRERWLRIETSIELYSEKTKEKKDMKRHFKLPDIKLKRFDGEIKNWLYYWGQFKKIDLDPNIDEDDKYLYLLQSMEEGTEVYKLVESYPPSGASYQLCIEELKNRYAREELLIEVYVREILSLVLQEKKDLIELYDKLNAHLRALNTLGVSKCAAFILPLVESALPTDILCLWERNKSSEKSSKGPEHVLETLMQFLKAEVESEQRIKIAKNTFNNIKEEEKEPSASCFFTTTKIHEVKNKTCIWCGKDSHSSVECYKLAKMSIEERRNHLKKENACTICLRKGHYFKTCKAFIKCHICGRRHSVAMCPGKQELHMEKNGESPKEKPHEKSQEKSTHKIHTTTTNLSSQGTQTLLQTVAVRLRNGGKCVTVRALFDNGSQRTYIKDNTALKLGLESQRKEDLKQCLFGGVVTETKKHNVYDINIESLDGNYNMDLEALGQNTICGYVEKLQLTKDIQKQLVKQNIKLNDLENCNAEIELLIGADYSGFLMQNGIVKLQNGMVAISTKLGWTIQGKQRGTSDNITSMFCMSKVNFTDLWSLETLGIRDPAEQKTKSQVEAEALASFEQTIKKEENGRYEVQLPFKVGHEDLLPNYNKAKQRLDSTTRKLISNGKFHEYDAVFKDWLSSNIIEMITSHDEERYTGHFLPHKAVIKESSLTSALRPVFDASTPDQNGLSLNTCLEKGLNFIDNIPNLLIGFRKGAIGITADIAKAFLQISLPPEDRNYLKFLWWEDDSLQKVIVYRHGRVVFGLTSSPFLLAATIKYHLSKVTGEQEKTAQLLQKSFYVDNCLTSRDTEEETLEFINEAKNIMKTAQFDLRMWVTSPLNINEMGKQIVPVLGLNWDTDSDELSCNITLPQLIDLNKITKRTVLSLTQKIFDPIGMTCPVTLPPKLLLQELWRRGLAWDTALPEDLAADFKSWYVHTQYLNKCKVPRRLSKENINECNLSLHMFCDASKNAMGICIYLRSEKQNKISIRLVAAKSRVAPPKNVSIPRLELMAAVIGVRLLVEARKSLQLPDCEEYCWTDSSVTIYWICKDLSWNTFVGNRVKEIKENTKTENWHHISGRLNWADVPSRGCNAKQLWEQKWVEGPPFLLSSSAEWPTSKIKIDGKEAEKELKKATCKVNVCTNESMSDRFLYFSKYSKIVRMVAWMCRFINNSLKKEKHMVSKQITGQEYEEAEKRIMILLQQENKDIIEQNIKNLNTFTDKDNIIRIKTKILLSDLPEDTKCPIVVTAKNKIIQRMLEQRHVQIQHAGTDTLITDVRKKFWVFGIRRLAKSIISTCMVCRKYKAKPMQAPTAPLPVDRMQSSTPFEVTGVDLAGPLIVKNGKKCWIVLYTCAVYRAVHLELTPSLSTEDFLRTFRRFIARRGRPETMYSDNGTNFIGSKNLLENVNWHEIEKETSMKKIKWKLNVPTAAWWGGFWERLIRSIKDLLRRVLGKASVTYDELQTLICDCESIMNNRPLTYVQDDKAESLEPLSPACFLQPLPSSHTTDLDQIDEKSLNLRLKYLQKLRGDFRQRFRSEYLTELVQRGKEKGHYQEIKEGQVVLIESEGKRIKWPMGIVTRIFTGKDGVHRSAEVKTSTGIKTRPVQRLYSLELTSENTSKFPSFNKHSKDQEENDTEEVTGPEQEKVTRCGRKVKLPSKYTW